MLNIALLLVKKLCFGVKKGYKLILALGSPKTYRLTTTHINNLCIIMTTQN